MESDLFDPYEKLVAVEIMGRRVEVPERNRLLRCFQFLSIETISYGDFCWNGDCTNCQFWYRDPGEDEDATEKTALSCRFRVREGLNVTRLNPCVQIEGVNAGTRDASNLDAETECVTPKTVASPAYQEF
jgi:hypothetical protein